MLSVRGGGGLGDAVYLQSVVRHLLDTRHDRLEVCTDWPDVFRPLKRRLKLSPFRKKPIGLLAHYSGRRTILTTTQFEDCCITAGISGPVDLRLDWQATNRQLIDRVRPTDRPLIIVQMPRVPFGRIDGFGLEFLPDCKVIQRAIDRIGDDAFLVQVGKGEPLFSFRGIHLDLSNRTSVSDLLDVCSVADGFLGYCSFILPIAEALSKPVLLVFSRRGLNSAHDIIRSMKPQKMLYRSTSRHVMDDCSDEDLHEAVDALSDQVRGLAKVCW